MLDKTRQNSNKVKDAILNYIKDNGLKPGDRCSSELYFSNSLKINRRTVRMAIDKLCEDGILRKEPSSGIFLARLPDESALADAQNTEYDNSLFPMGSCFLPQHASETITFGLDDSKIHNWDLILSEFEKHTGYKIRVIPKYLIRYNDPSTKIPECDIYLISIRNIRIGGIDLAANPSFPADWFSVNPLIKSMNPELADRIIKCSLNDAKAPAIVPIGFSIPFQLINKSMLKSLGLSEPPVFPSLGQFNEWVSSLGGKCENRIFPFIQNSLQHFCRMNRNVIADEKSGKIKIDFPECRELFALQKRYFRKFLLEREEFVFPAMQNVLKTGDFFLIEFFSNAMSYIKSFYPNANEIFSSIADCMDEENGLSQLVLRFLMLGPKCGNQKAACEFACFMASPAGQRLIAEQRSIFPCYHSDENINTICNSIPLKPEIVFREIKNATGFFDSRFFAAEFEERVLNPVMRLYFADTISLDEAIQKIEASDFIAKNTQPVRKKDL